ncbi:hypothetical protein DYB28_007876 [Aphanomyces astaci]|uniref:Uncharacterized protein n=1 Tax=Aphanomyces astaci TaxID=112090 RepID=A0A9X8HAL8_APHAT|nr:hypothetical protein DYB28_007876 [Aphanomyces astaci]
MKTVVCLVKGKICRIDLNESLTVGFLMAKVKEQQPLQSFWMDVYLMKRNGKWLKSGDPDAQEFMRRGQSNGIRAMMQKHGAMHASTEISDPAIGFPDTEAIEDDDIHVFVHTQSPDDHQQGIPRTTWLTWLSKKDAYLTTERNKRCLTLGGQGKPVAMQFANDLLAFMKAVRADSHLLTTAHMVTWIKTHQQSWVET